MPTPPPSQDNPSTLATMFSRMKSQLTSSTSTSSTQSNSNEGMNVSQSTGSIPGSPAGKTRPKSTQAGTPSKIPIPVTSSNLTSSAPGTPTRGAYAVPPSPSRERTGGQAGNGSYHQVQEPAYQTRSQQQQHSTGNNPMPPPASSNRSLHPRQDAHLAAQVSGLPATQLSSYQQQQPYQNQQQHQQQQQQQSRQGVFEENDIHMMTVNPSAINPSLLRELAQQPAASPVGSTGSSVPIPSIPEQRINLPPPSSAQALRGGRALPKVVEDVKMQTVLRSGAGGKEEQQGQLDLWEREILASAEVKRKATLAQLYFLDYYFDLLGYLHARKGRLSGFKNDVAARGLGPEETQKEYRSYAGRERVLLRKRRIKLRVEQFRIIAQVGQGGYGSVYLARKADTGQVCALKKMKKTTLAKMDEVKHVLIERDILTATKTPWLVSLLYAFQDRDHVYLAMEYVPGGDFRTLLNNSGVLKEEHARFYSAEMFMGVSELHKLGYIHRDLKPENFLVDSTGHVKLTDFGLATGALNPQKIESMKNKLDQVKDENLVVRSTLERRTMYKSMRMAEPRYADSVVGSPDYMPPEVLRGKTYTYSADYWSLGCILFEFLCGFPPFSGSTPEETWVNLKNWQKVLRRPVYDKPEDLIFNLTDQAWDAVIRLIAHPKDRVSTIQEVQSLQFYNDLPFKSLRQMSAPFVPMLDSDTDVGYFDSFNSPEDMAKYAEVFKKQADVEAVREKGSGERNAWVGFTFGRNANVPAAAPRRKPEGEALHTMF